MRRTGFETRLLVTAVDAVATDVVALTLSRPDSTPLPLWTPGAHIDVITSSGLLRHYSLTGDRRDRLQYRIAVRRVAGGAGSAELHDLRPGDTLQVRGPRNAFNFAAAEHYVFVAGGIGITPILPMVREAVAAGHQWQLLYTGRTRASMPFAAELMHLGGNRVQILPDDENGIPDLTAVFEEVPDGAAFYVCGPAGMIDAAAAAARAHSPAPEFHSERFGAPPVLDGRPFTITLARSAATINVDADETALQAIRRVQPSVRYSCQQGFCGACRVHVLEGAVEHRDRVLTVAEQADSMMICVSRATEDAIVIDL
ncbi:PDR/VanB family oxidoreductase [Mycolicibacterium cosmeticum]|uniref:PDR/VanB family oxidoreductase n=1 Tax=Mycolicibacterium cosmeticum TaxID=258533 RepID=UPI002795D5DB|nr:PDR/VanB family oxidoreductase [Mycolicibacterium cosmeticum]